MAQGLSPAAVVVPRGLVNPVYVFGGESRNGDKRKTFTAQTRCFAHAVFQCWQTCQPLAAETLRSCPRSWLADVLRTMRQSGLGLEPLQLFPA
ncbi:unnamed protein product, partial [Amoebophrya sp. A25]|eukprot:GSA25T00002090001.1